jgi:hypothetical protein
MNKLLAGSLVKAQRNAQMAEASQSVLLCGVRGTRNTRTARRSLSCMELQRFVSRGINLIHGDEFCPQS